MRACPTECIWAHSPSGWDASSESLNIPHLFKLCSHQRIAGQGDHTSLSERLQQREDPRDEDTAQAKHHANIQQQISRFCPVHG